MVFLAALFATMPLSMMAQDDDLYFNPKQEAKREAAFRHAVKAQRDSLYALMQARRDSVYSLYWTGSNRSVDDYNRHGRIYSQYQNIHTDSLGNDIIDFRIGRGVRPDTIYSDDAVVRRYLDRDDDFEYTRGFSRWDGYYNPWFYDYYGVGPYYWRSAYWGWRNPWRYGYYAGWYDPWFDPFYDPWFYDPWYYGYMGWYGGWYGWGCYDPWYWSGPIYVPVSHGARNSAGYAGTRSFKYEGGNRSGYSGNRYTYRSNSNRSFGGRSTNNGSGIRYNSGNTGTFNNSNFSGFGSHSGSSFGGGSRSGGGGFSGGSRSGGGGGHSFGGRR